MDYKLSSFRIQLVIRILLIAVNMLAGFYLYYVNSFLLLVPVTLLLIIQLFLLVRYVDTTNRRFSDFLSSINYSDFSQSIPISKQGRSFEELSGEMNKVLLNFKKLRLEKEESLRFIETIIDHVGIGLLSFNCEGELQLINRAAKKLLKIQNLRHISSLDNDGNAFGRFLMDMAAGSRLPFKIIDNGEVIQLMIQCTSFRLKNQELKLISLYNIQHELEEKEIEAWQKLIRVLTHEIMNSITPISSLAATTSDLLKSDEHNSIPDKDVIADMRAALTTIRKRSDGLVNFVNKFRDVSKIYKPDFQQVRLRDLFYRIRLLVETMSPADKIKFIISIEPENLEITADPDLMEQVLINLIKNSIQALNEIPDAEIKLTAEINERSKAVIKVIDNGSGISGDIIDRIFVPFYSTKREGSGIGLSISQSIIRAHGGSISVQSVPDKTTTFTIVLN